MGLSVDILGHFWLLPRWSKSLPCTRSPNTPSPSCFYPPKSVPLSLNAYTSEALIDPGRIISNDVLITELITLRPFVMRVSALWVPLTRPSCNSPSFSAQLWPHRFDRMNLWLPARVEDFQVRELFDVSAQSLVVRFPDSKLGQPREFCYLGRQGFE